MRKLLGITSKSKSSSTASASSTNEVKRSTESKMKSIRKLLGITSKSKSSSTASASSTNEVKRSTESKTVTAYKSEQIEAWPSTSPLPNDIKPIVLGYLAKDVDANPERYTPKQLSTFTLFDIPLGLAIESASKIGPLILAGQRTQTLALIRENPTILECLIRGRDPVGWLAEGTPLQLAAAAGDHILVREIRKLFPSNKQKQMNS